jgi:hypothetical protein
MYSWVLAVRLGDGILQLDEGSSGRIDVFGVFLGAFTLGAGFPG